MLYKAYLKNESGARLDVDFVSTSVARLVRVINANYGKGWTATIYRGEETIKQWKIRGNNKK